MSLLGNIRPPFPGSATDEVRPAVGVWLEPDEDLDWSGAWPPPRRPWLAAFSDAQAPPWLIQGALLGLDSRCHPIKTGLLAGLLA